MSLPYSILGNYTGSIYSGSYLNEQDNNIFAASQSVDLFFGNSNRDVTEVSIFNTFDNPISWSVLNRNNKNNFITLTYTDVLNNTQNYTYKEVDSDYNIYQGKTILLNPITDLSASGVFGGTYKVSYVFSRDMAGSPIEPLVISDISPSRKEIKLIPKSSVNIPYTAFCLKKFPIDDISPILLTITQKCPYDQIYSAMYNQYKQNISSLKSMFFLYDDGSVVTFIKNLYEDLIKYTLLSQSEINYGSDPTRIYRIQGIKSYFNNYLLQNSNLIADFNDIENKFISFVNLRIEQAFIQYKGQNTNQYVEAKQFCYDFFTKYFYSTFITRIKLEYQSKYFSPFKNVLNFGNNKYFAVLNNGYLDERNSPSDPLTLILKFSSELPSEISIKDECWVSNFGMTPYVFTVILRDPIQYKTLRIGPPNFGTTTQFINKENVNKLYSSDDLELENTTENEVSITKKLSKLNIDYSNFSNFIVFSSAVNRVNIFKNKIKSYYTLSGSLQSIENSYLNSLSSSVIYPYYLQEKEDVQEKIDELISSFDGYESYLFDSKNYLYNISSDQFTDNVFIDNTDYSASIYDKFNKDSLINNTPEYILDDNVDNQDYLTFLTMVGHHFDNIYTYISALPIERQIKNNINGSLPINTLKELLYSFGWNVDDIINSLNVDQVYLNSLNSSVYNTLSAEQRLQIIWNRILVTLPGIYKTKGTEDCVKFLMACYGLPSSLISIREYGGTDYDTENYTPTYKLDEKLYMLRFSGVNDKIEGPYPSSTKTIEFKFSIESSSYYNEWERKSLFSLYPYQESDSAWSVDIYKTPGEYTGKIAFQMRSGSTGTSIISDPLPIFNGKIFSVMVRKNDVNSNFEYNTDSNTVPIQYDLIIQRNEDGRKIFYFESSSNFYSQDNKIFSKFGRFNLSDGTFIGTLDKLQLWDVALNDEDFEEHVNDLNSYAYSGSTSYQHLLVRLNWDYPQNMYTGSPSLIWIDNKSTYYQIPNYHSSTYISSSIIPSFWTASQDIIEKKWLTYYPTGSVDIIGLNFPIVVNPNWSSSFNCVWNSSSIYPWHFRELEYQQDLDGSKFGPNKFKNKKVRKIDYTIESRFDSNDRSTFDEHVTTTGESNQIGFFIDPQDAKNKDIIRYVGHEGIMQSIADPRNLYKNRYEDLIKKNKEYNLLGNKQTLFNEMLTIYKFYFDKSVFEAIKNVVPARSNLFTGVVIEPTILERPKYQNKQIVSEIPNYNESTVINNIYDLSTTPLWGMFGTRSVDFIGYQQSIDLNYISNPIKIMPSNIEQGINGYVTDFMDKIQFGHYADFEKFPRMWELGKDSYSAPNGWPTDGIFGSTVYDSEMENRLIITSSQNTRLYTTSNPIAAGYNNNNHQKLYYILKAWDKYNYYSKTGEYVRSTTPTENQYNSASIYLYKYIIVSEPMMRELIYFYNLMPGIPANTDPSFDYIVPNFRHYANTFIGTPNQRVSNVYLIPGSSFPNSTTDYTLGIKPTQHYFEISCGYPRNHYTHKMQTMTKIKHPRYGNVIYVKGRNTVDDTVNETGINDGTYPVISNNVSNVNVINSGNVIQYSSTPEAGTVIPGARASNTSNASVGGTTNSTKTTDSNTTPVGGTGGSGGTTPATSGRNYLPRPGATMTDRYGRVIRIR